jgi:hypothetical protein
VVRDLAYVAGEKVRRVNKELRWTMACKSDARGWDLGEDSQSHERCRGWLFLPPKQWHSRNHSTQRAEITSNPHSPSS